MESSVAIEKNLPSGQKTLEEQYHGGWLEKLTQYDNAGNTFAVDSFPKVSGKYTLLYPNKQIKVQANYVNGDFNGPYKTFYFDGSPESIIFYKNGLADSSFISYFHGGT